MLHTRYSNRTERLLEALFEWLQADAVPALVAETIVVPTAGMARWLQLRIADRFGVCANIRFPLPAGFVWNLFRAALPALPETSRFAPSVLAWRIADLLAAARGDRRYAMVDAYLNDGDERKRHELARRIAEMFDQYLLFRPDWIRAWEKGGESAADDWQALLWRQLVAGERMAHWVHAHDAFIAALADGMTPPPALPARVALFAVPSLSPAYLEVIDALARRIEVHAFVLNPCRQYWGDIVSEREQARQAGNGASSSLYLETGHGLLAAWGRPARDFIDRLIEIPCVEHQDFTEAEADSVLHAVQGDILDLHDRGRDETPPYTPAVDDLSIQVHVCHSPMREVEVLHDRLLAMFETAEREGRELLPSQVLVVTPDLHSYAPYIAGVFGAAGGARHIPYSLAGLGQPNAAVLVDGFFALLDLPESRFGAEAVLAPLETPSVRRRFGLDEDDLVRLREWVTATGIRWALDADQRATLGLPVTNANTWQAGLDRMLLGYALPGGGERLYAGILPHDDIEGSQARCLGNFLVWLDALRDFRDRLAGRRSVAGWVETLNALCTTFFEADEDEEATIQLLRDALAEMARDARLAGYSAAVGLDVIGDELRRRLEETGTGGAVLSGGVCFTSLAAMRSLPFEVVCVLGMNDGALPQLDRRVDFDKLAQDRRRGDRVRRDEDRHLFLEMLLAARHCLYLSYVGRDVRSDEPLPPSVLVSELLDYLDRAVSVGAEERLADRIVFRHPLQPFSARYFSGDARLFSYRAELCIPLTPAPTPLRRPMFSAPLPEPAEPLREIALGDFLGFFRHPVRFLLQRRLNLNLYEADTTLDNDEPFVLDRYAGTDLLQRATQLCIAGVTAADVDAHLRATGVLPHGQAGEILAHSLLSDAQRHAASLRPRLRAGTPLTLDFEIEGVRLHGVLAEVTAAGLQRWLARDEIAPVQWLEFWLQHLLLNAVRTQGEGRHSELLLIDNEVRLQPVDDAHALLADLLAMVREGRTRPLHFFPKSAWAYSEADAKGSDALKAARSAWLGNNYVRGEGQNAYYRLAFGDSDPLDAEFEQLASRVFAPLRTYREGAS